MAKISVPKHHHARERVAHLAAKLMAEDGIEDFALAKRKAARHLGVGDINCLPGNVEIETALRQYHAIYQEEEQRERIRALRRHAMAMMKRLERFDPHLTGQVLAGTATRHAPVNLVLFADSDKEVEWFLLSQGIVFRRGEKKLRFDDAHRAVPTFAVESRLVLVEMAVLSVVERRMPPRSAVDGRAIAWAGLSQVERLMAEEGAARRFGPREP